MEWTLFTEDLKKCTITWYDDGNNKYELYNNLWFIIGDNNQGKIKLKNIENSAIIIDSISNWKTTMY